MTLKRVAVQKLRGEQNNLSVENVIFSADGGFLFGTVAGYAIKTVMKMATIIIGLFVVDLPYLSYRGWIDVKWM